MLLRQPVNKESGHFRQQSSGQPQAALHDKAGHIPSSTCFLQKFMCTLLLSYGRSAQMDVKYFSIFA
jgi:hypothetical protein